ncbi:MAG: beta-N-acetylhexosaminidase [Fimbriimonadales bacterium]|nr:beta-N-acetylhexosaminidase [Fimbriimonadales bacterium]
MNALLAGIVLGFEWNAGITASFSGVPLVRGSSLQIYEPGWTKGYYSSTYGQKRVERLPDGGFEMRFETPDGLASGSMRATRAAEGYRLEGELLWKGPKPAAAEVAGALLWAPALDRGRLEVDGRPARSLARQAYASSTDLAERSYGEGRRFRFAGPLGELEVEASSPGWVVFDARGYGQPFAENDDLFWLGHTGLALEPGRPLRFSLDFRWKSKPVPKVGPAEVRARSRAAARAADADGPPPLVPRPKEVRLTKSLRPLGPAPELRLPRALRGFEPHWRDFYASLWEPSRGPSATVDVRIRDLGLPPEGYLLEIRPDGIEAAGQDAEGARNALYTLALLARPSKGALQVPIGTVRDWPSARFRGVHLFVGPESKEFQERLFRRVLRALKMNRAVFQCERTDWSAFPAIRTELTMGREALAERFAFVRSLGIEPIPLIQSLGHMEWFFANGQNLDLAFNPSQPYGIDPRKPGARRALEAIWDEAIRLLRPETVHFGLDEIDMVGFPDDPELVTELWESGLGILRSIAERHGVRGMLWGDMALAPGEAPDAANGHSPEQARRRRAAIPKGWMIADWHYAARPSPEPFRRSLGIWKAEGFEPVASTWYAPDNVRSFTLAAIEEGCGTLQTTWAGYTSTERAMREQWAQAAAYVLSADYAWSGRRETIAELDYVAGDLLRRLIGDRPGRVQPRRGAFALWRPTGREAQAAGSRVALNEPLALATVAREGGEALPMEARVAWSASGRTLVVALAAAARGKDGELAGVLAVRTDRGKLELPIRYGAHVRAPSDRGALAEAERAAEGACLVAVPLGERSQRVREVALTAANRHSGLSLLGLTVY